MIAGNESPSRRAIFGLVASVGAVAVAGPIAAAAPVADTSAWDSAMRELVRAEAAYEEDKRTFEPLAEKWRAGRPDDDMVDWSALLDGRRSAIRSYDLDAAEAATRRQIERGYFRGVTWRSCLGVDLRHMIRFAPSGSRRRPTTSGMDTDRPRTGMPS